MDVADVTRGRLVVTIDEEGATRLRDRFRRQRASGGTDPPNRARSWRSCPPGRCHGPDRPEPPALLDPRAYAEAMAAVQTAEASLGRARAEERRARAALAQAQRELVRTGHLLNAGATTRQDLEGREADVALASEAVNAAAVCRRRRVGRTRAREGTRRAARSRRCERDRGGHRASRWRRAPSPSRKRDRRSRRRAARRNRQSTPDGGVVDLLSTDAVRVKPGAPAFVEQWGGETPLAAVVRRIEPGGSPKYPRSASRSSV